VSDLATAFQQPDVLQALKTLPPEKRLAYLWRANWVEKAHRHQMPPPGDWWTIWLLLAGRGAGKTRTAAEQVGWWAWTEPGTRWLVGAPTSADVKATCFEGDSGLLNVIPAPLIADYNKQHHELKLTNGSLIKGIPASEPERFRGPQFHGAWLDELAAWEYLQEAWDQIQFSVRLGSRTRIVATTTPRPKDLIVELVGREGDDVALTTASTYANLANLAPSFQKQILQYEGTKLGRQEIHAEIIDPEEGGIVQRSMFKLWPDGKAFPKFEYIVQSYDCATSEKTQNDPTACTTWGVFKPLDGPMSAMLIDCWQERMQYPDLRPKVIDEYETIFGEGKEKKRVDLILIEDKSAGISLIQDLQRAHLPVRAYNPGKADKLQRLNIVSNIISRGRVWIPESSQRKGYVRDWAEGFVSQICSFPETTHDDFVDSCVDSLTQVQMVDGVKAIKDVVVGDLVVTPAGPRRVTAVHDNGMKEVWNVDGLLATAEHRVFTQHGWVRVDCLTQGIHNVYLYQGGSSWVSSQKAWLLKRWSSMAAGTTDILRAITRRTAGTLQGLGTVSTGMSGSTTTAPYQRGCTSTTSTAIPRTTTSATWPASQGRSIGTVTAKRSRSATEALNSLPTLSGSEAAPLNGTDHQRVWNGIGSTQRDLLQRLGAFLGSMRRQPLIAFGAAKRLCARVRGACSAAPRAKAQSLSSGLVSPVTNTRTMRHVYDLTVEGEHCYYANGILVHNCTQALRFLRDAGWLEVDPPPRDDWDEEDYADSGRVRRTNPYSE
jgi:predicted phage terminase large subunit-like protein